MANRRENNTGGISLRGDGKWVASYKIGIRANGKPAYKYLYGKTQAEVVEKMDALKLSLGMGIKVQEGDITVSRWCHEWLNNYKRKLKPTTKMSYQNNIRIHIDTSDFAGDTLGKLTTGKIQMLVDEIYDNGKNSVSLVIKVYSILRGALNQAVKNKWLEENPCDGVILPENDVEQVTAYTCEEQKAFENALEGEQYRVLFMCYLYTGARLGELPALTWRDINIDVIPSYIDLNKKVALIHDCYADGKKTEVVVQPFLKTKSSKRKVYITQKLVDILKEEKQRQQEQCQQLGEKWSEDKMVFATSVGTVLHPRNVQHMFRRIRNKAGINHGTLHVLRHTYATRCFECEVEIKFLSEQLGHRDVKTTYGTYIHLMNEKRVVELDKLEKLNNLDQAV